MAVQGSENDKSFYDCKVYSKEEDRPTEKTECVHDYQDGLYYCKSWECEVPSCPREEQVDQEGEPCPLCPGTYCRTSLYTYLNVIFHSLFTWLLCRVDFKNFNPTVQVYLFCMFVSSFVSGTCTTGGKIYSVGETVPCYDRVNSCGCISTGQGFSTLIATNKYSLCGAPFPTE